MIAPPCLLCVETIIATLQEIRIKVHICRLETRHQRDISGNSAHSQKEQLSRI